MNLLDGKTGVVTGGAQGLGLATVEAFLDAGARVVVADLDLEAARDAAEQLADRGAVESVRCDVQRGEDLEAVVRSAVELFDSLDVMVSNAGFTRDATMRKMTEDQFDQVISVHLKGCWNGLRQAAAVMRDQGSGSIISLSSISGKVGFVGQMNYSAAKAGIIGMTEAAAKELAHSGVRVNAVQPGLIRTAMTEAMPQRIWDTKLAEIPLQRAGEPAEVASVNLFMASDMSSYVTGTEVTGGRFM